MGVPKRICASLLNARTICILLVTLAAVGCTPKEPVRIGVALELTGHEAELGVQERNGIQLAVDDINASGGIGGRPIELVIRDDSGTPEGAQQVDRDLIKSGVVAIIGHATSKQAKAALPVIDGARMVFMTPTAAAPELSGVSRYFFRVTASSTTRIRSFAERVYQRRGVKKLVVLYDTDNLAYSKSYLSAFAARYQSLGGKIMEETGFSSKKQPDFSQLLSSLRAHEPEGLLIIAADFDTALIAQRARLGEWQIPLFTAGWAQTETLIKNGGRAVEGMELTSSYAFDSTSRALQDFMARYSAKFGRTPSYGATYGYEALSVMATALRRTNGKAEGLQQALLEIPDFKGLIDNFSFDKQGNAMRASSIAAIQDGRFVTVQIFPPPQP